MGTERGWIEQKQGHSVAGTANVTFRVLNPDEIGAVLSEPRYEQTVRENLKGLADKFHSYHLVHKDLTVGSFTLTGEQEMRHEDMVEFTVLPPKYISPVTMLGEVKWIKSYNQQGKAYHTAHLEIVALDSESMDRLNRYLFAEKVKRDNADKS